MSKYRTKLKKAVHDALLELANIHEEADRNVDALQCRLLCDDVLPDAPDPLAVLDKAPRPPEERPWSVTPETLLDRVMRNFHAVEDPE